MDRDMIMATKVLTVLGLIGLAAVVTGGLSLLYVLVTHVLGV